VADATEPAPCNPQLSLPPFTLELSDLSVERGGRPVLRRLSLGLTGGQVVAVLGRNGVGKTTLLRAIAGLQPYTGRLAVHSGGAASRPEFGLVFQNPDLQLFNASVRDEILYRLPDPDLSRYAWIIDVLDLRRYEHTPPLLLSEGEKRRLAFAAILMRLPRHGILLDEPSLGQDRLHKAILLRTVKALAQAGSLVILATHDIALASHADRVLLMSQEGWLADGPPTEVFQTAAAWEKAGIWLPYWIALPA
jgi:energy-coupling factor transport system ATP-binding protein